MARQEINGRPSIWRPQPRQAAFMRRSEDEALYGGAAGGEIVAAGTPHEIACAPRSYTGEFLKKLGL